MAIKTESMLMCHDKERENEDDHDSEVVNTIIITEKFHRLQDSKFR